MPNRKFGLAFSKDWLKVLAMAVAAGAVALAVSLLIPGSYVSESRVLVLDTESRFDVFGIEQPAPGTPGDEIVATQAELMRSPELLAGVAKRLGMEAKRLAEGVEVSQVGRSAVVAVSATSDSPEQAKRIADEIAASYVEMTTRLRQDSLKATQAELEYRVSEADEALREIDDRAVSQGLAASDATARQIAADRLLSLSKELDEVRLAQGVEQGWGIVTDAASLPEQAAGPSPAGSTLFGMIAGALLGILVLGWREFRVEPEKRVSALKDGDVEWLSA